MYQDIRFEIARERYQSMLREAENQRMTKVSQDSRSGNNSFLASILVEIGLAMVRAGRRMQRAHSEMSHQAFDPCAQTELGMQKY